VHDIVDLEARGVVGVFVASTEFLDAATAQARALGADPASVFVAHPIQDRTDDELRALADAAVDEIIAAVTDREAPPPPS
jgi:alkanesulfonate monooxygenase SsuD/methylene tetrahydromethanopterin reductase-like flavin-dependent oxidoreductase (luciferase family)